MFGGMIASALLILSGAAQPAAPPRLSLAGVPAAVRGAVQQAYDRARSHPRDAAAAQHLAMLLHAYDQYALADASYQIARQLAPASVAPAYLSGVVEAQRGDLAAAAESLRHALSIDATYLPARLRLAETLMNAGDFDASRAVYEALTHDYAELAVAHYGLGRLAEAHGDRADAARHYERAVAAAPEFGAAHYALALMYRDGGDAARAGPHLDAATRFGSRRPAVRDPLLEEVNALRSTARDLIADGSRLERAGRIDEAIAKQLAALEADPDAAQAHVNLITLYGRTGAFAKAEEHYRAALRLNSSLAEAHYNYGVLLAHAGREGDAADAFSNTLAVDPFYPPAHDNLAALLAREGRYDEAAAHYRQALANDPQHRPARFNLAQVLLALGRPGEAIEQLRRALSPEDAETPRYAFTLARAYLAAGEPADARRQAEYALRLAERYGQRPLAAAIRAALQQIPVKEARR